MKSAIKLEFLDLKKVKDLEYQNIFRQEIRVDEKYKTVSDDEAKFLVGKIGKFAGNIVGCIDSLVERSPSKQEALNILRDIFEGKIKLGSYAHKALSSRITNLNKTTDEVLITLNDSDYELIKSLKFLKSLPDPDNFDSKPYRDDYLAFCRKVVKEITPCVFEKYQKEIEQEREAPTQAGVKRGRGITFADMVQAGRGQNKRGVVSKTYT